jgi:hypothetical protein
MSAFVKPAPGTKVGTTGTAASIVAYYLLNDNAGTVADSSIIGGNPGTVNGGLTWGASPDATVISGECLNGFAGVPSATTAFVDLGASSVLNPTAAAAYEIWFYPTFIPSDVVGWMLGRDDGTNRSYALGFVVGGDIFGQINGVNQINFAGSGSNVVTANKWNHMIVTGSAVDGHWHGYINGGLIGTASWLAPNAVTTHAFIGRRLNSGDQSAFNGTIGLVSIRNALLSAGDVATLFSNPGIVFPAVAGGWSNYYTVENQNN